MAHYSATPAMESTFERLCNTWDHATVCIGGDSQARRMGQAMFRDIGYGQMEGGVRLATGRFNFGSGGATCANYHQSAAFDALKYSSADIVLLTCGGNDLDLPGVITDGRDVIYGLLKMFIDLEVNYGKVVFIIGIPRRYSKRNKDPARGEENEKAMERKLIYINKTLKMIIKGRLISLPATVNQKNAFQRVFRQRPNGQGFEEFVHLKETNYHLAGTRALQMLNTQLIVGSNGRKCPPSFIARTINQFMSSRPQQ